MNFDSFSIVFVLVSDFVYSKSRAITRAVHKWTRIANSTTCSHRPSNIDQIFLYYFKYSIFAIGIYDNYPLNNQITCCKYILFLKYPYSSTILDMWKDENFFGPNICWLCPYFAIIYSHYKSRSIALGHVNSISF